MCQENNESSIEMIFRRIREEIIPLFQQAIHDDEVYFHNPSIPSCWEIKECLKKDCPDFGKISTRCWQSAGTFCGGKVQGTFTDKYESCLQCNIFKQSCPTLVEELGENLNNLLFLLRKEKSTTQKQMKKIDYLNRELLSSLENLDGRNREIQELVITDKLTGLYNRHYLRTVLDDEFHRCERGEYSFSLMMLDLDDFKSVNDTYGHIKGDEMLSSLGRMLREDVRKGDRSFRYGGEEFVVILPNTDMTITWMIAERFRKRFEGEGFAFEGKDAILKTISRTLSIGIACYEEGITAEKLIKRADEAMYKAKMEGKNKVIRYGMD